MSRCNRVKLAVYTLCLAIICGTFLLVLNKDYMFLRRLKNMESFESLGDRHYLITMKESCKTLELPSLLFRSKIELVGKYNKIIYKSRNIDSRTLNGELDGVQEVIFIGVRNWNDFNLKDFSKLKSVKFINCEAKIDSKVLKHFPGLEKIYLEGTEYNALNVDFEEVLTDKGIKEVEVIGDVSKFNADKVDTSILFYVDLKSQLAVKAKIHNKILVR